MSESTATVGDFDGLVAVVTGGASGIGAATVAELRTRGARVASLDLSTETAADLSVRCDVADDGSSAPRSTR